MKVIIHVNEIVTKVISPFDEETVEIESYNPVNLLRQLSEKFPDEILGWCEESLVPLINFKNWKEIFHHDSILASYSTSGKFELSKEIGYVENSPFLKFDIKKGYPTWLMSSDIGGVHSKVINVLDEEFFQIPNFSYFLNCVGKQGQLNSIFCYSEPRLINSSSVQTSNTSLTRDVNMLFRFVKQNYRFRWSIFLLLCFLWYNKRLEILPFINNLKYKSLRNLSICSGLIQVISTKKVTGDFSLDVIIPTLGRKQHLYNVLCDFKVQSLLPSRVFIVEQNSLKNAKSELGFLFEESWPFEIVHHFSNQPGACKARNWALKRVKNEWVFFSDDDVRFNKNFIEDAFQRIQQYGVECASFSCVGEFGEGIKGEKINQSTVFGSGNSFVKRSVLAGLHFSENLELGYGEDMDFGMKLRNNGIDVIHFPDPQLKHLKAERGGFRSVLGETLNTQPAPTVLWIKLRHLTKEQFLGYKTFYFFSQFKKGNYNFLRIQKRWNRSLLLAKNL